MGQFLVQSHRRGEPLWRTFFMGGMAVIAMAEVGRALRFVNVAFGLWLIAAPWLLSGGRAVASWTGAVVGVVVIMLSLPRGPRSNEHYGGWDRYVV